MNNNQFKSFIELDMSHHTPGANTRFDTSKFISFDGINITTMMATGEKEAKKKLFLFFFFHNLIFQLFDRLHLNNGTLGARTHTPKSIPKHLSFSFSLLRFCFANTIFFHFNFQFPNELTEKKI